VESQVTTTPSKLLALQATEAPQQRELSHGLTEWLDWMPKLSFTEFSRVSMTQAMRGLENDPVAYSVDDLKERWQ